MPDPNVPNNILSDAYYRKLGYANMTFDQAYDEIKRVYDETAGESCSSDEFCACANSYQIYKDEDLANEDYRVMFSNETILAQAKKIVSEFMEKYKDYILSEKEYTQYCERYDFSLPPTLIAFFLKYDFTFKRLYAYDPGILPDNEFIYFDGVLKTQKDDSVLHYCIYYLCFVF